MLIDNSQANQFRTCPLQWYETNIADGTGLELKPQGNEVAPIDLGSRVHEMLEEHYNAVFPNPPDGYRAYPESPNAALEIEAQMIMAAYKAKYPMEQFEIVDVERTFKVALPRLCPKCYRYVHVVGLGGWCDHCNQQVFPGEHIYTGKIDVTFRENGRLNIMDHKTERRRSNSNHPKKWAARDQASLYLWAASKIYQEEIGSFYVNILKRPSNKLQEGPLFPDRQRLERTQEQIDIAVRDIVIVADEIERYKAIFGNGLWPASRENCSSGWGECDFYLPHTYGWSQEIREQKFQPKTPYLKLGDVQIIQP
jgi:hypothetical protein